MWKERIFLIFFIQNKKKRKIGKTDKNYYNNSIECVSLLKSHSEKENSEENTTIWVFFFCALKIYPECKTKWSEYDKWPNINQVKIKKEKTNNNILIRFKIN